MGYGGIQDLNASGQGAKWHGMTGASLNHEAALPTVLLKASLLARMAERCQRHVLKEALHLLWKLLCLKF